MVIAPTLPDLNTLEQEALKALIVAQHDSLLAQQNELTTTQERLRSRESEIEHLKLLIAKLQRLQFGRKSEKVQRQIEQLELRLEDLQTNRPETSEPRGAASSTPIPVAKPTRRPLPEHLPRQTQRHEPPQQTCPECGGALRQFGEDVSEVLEYMPAQFKVIRHVRPKLSCTKCERVVQAAAPSRPIERGLAGPGSVTSAAGSSALPPNLSAVHGKRRAPLWWLRLLETNPDTTVCRWTAGCDRIAAWTVADTAG